MSCPNCGYCEKCGRSDDTLWKKLVPNTIPRQPYFTDGSWICACGQRVYSMQYHICSQIPSPRWFSGQWSGATTTTTFTISGESGPNTSSYNRTQ